MATCPGGHRYGQRACRGGVSGAVERNLHIYELKGGKLRDTGKKFGLPGQPAALRAVTR